jgi:Secretion system C-terminal sorting domain
MKTTTRSTLLIAALVTVHSMTFGQKTYSITSNTKWSAVLPSPCDACTIDISSGVTLTIDENATCQNCVISGGAMSMTGETLNIQYTGAETTTDFSNTTLTVSDGTVTVNAPLYLSNSTITLSNGSSMTTSYSDSLKGSTIQLNDNSTMTATGGTSTDIALASTSQIIVGNGSSTSTATLNLEGPTVNIYDNSDIKLGNSNNVYSNWASFNYYPNVNANHNSGKAYSSQNNTINCGSGYSHSCSNPYVYGPASLSQSGLTSISTLPVVLTGFEAELENNRTVVLTWTTELEVNSSHFTVERSADGENWTAIGTVEARGNSSIAVNYAFTDEQPLTGTNFYRLEMVDLDNSTTYSQVEVVRTSGVTTISFFPNPARDYVNVSLADNNNNASTATVTVRLVNVMGQVMQEKQVENMTGTVVTFQVTNYAAGVYILTVEDANGLRESKELMISRL